MESVWKNEVEREDRVLFRGCRQSGKTLMAARWARRAQGQTLVLVANEQNRKQMMEMLLTTCERKDIRSYSSEEVKFTNGNQVFLRVAGSDTVRGLLIDNIAVDGADEMSENDLLQALHRVQAPDFGLFASYTSHRSGAVKLCERVGDMKRVTVDYLDLLEQGVFRADDIRELRKMMRWNRFAEEFGPYEKERQRTLTNRSFSYLLDQVK